MDLFESASERYRETTMPLSARMRPRRLVDIIGQDAVVDVGSTLRAAVEAGSVPSVLFFGPPGTGKTSIAFALAAETNCTLVSMSAVSATVKDVRDVIHGAHMRTATGAGRTILFLDEIHRFNKAQQDALLPAVEDGSIILFGATTENPFFELNAPLLSRLLIVRLEPLTDEATKIILARAVEHPDGLKGDVGADDDAFRMIAEWAAGDARRALNLLERSATLARSKAGDAEPIWIDVETVRSAASSPRGAYDKQGDWHYDLASALIKSIRGSDPDAALYYLAAMLAGGEDPLFIARRMIVLASENIGNADPLAIIVAVSVFEACERVGSPECDLNLAHAVTYLSCAPKSNASYIGLQRAREAVQHNRVEVPSFLRDSHHPGARTLGHGEGYVYPHDRDGHFEPVGYLPNGLKGSTFYQPSREGLEREISERLTAWRSAIRDVEAEDDLTR